MKKIVYVREIPIGTKHVVIQSMTNTKTSDVTKTVEQIKIKMNMKKSFLFIKNPHVK